MKPITTKPIPTALQIWMYSVLPTASPSIRIICVSINPSSFSIQAFLIAPMLSNEGERTNATHLCGWALCIVDEMRSFAKEVLWDIDDLFDCVRHDVALSCVTLFRLL